MRANLSVSLLAALYCVAVVKGNPALVEWFTKTPGTFLHPSVEIRPRSAGGAGLGLFAKAPIKESDLVLEIPSSLIMTPLAPDVGDVVEVKLHEEGVVVDGVIKSIADGKYTVLREFEDAEPLEHVVELKQVAHLDLGVNCGSVRRIHKEIAMGDKSAYAAWLRVVTGDGSAKQPSVWSPAGKALLKELLGKDAENNEILPPFGVATVAEDNWVKQCRGKPNDPAEEDALFLTLQRSTGGYFVPMFDLIGHRNGKWFNVDHSSIYESVYENTPIRVTAVRDIAAGEELFTSLNQCDDCEARHFDWGAPEILRDYGYVEEYPQRWVFYFKDADKLVFDIDQEANGEFKVLWSDHFRLPGEADLMFFQDQLVRLEQFGATHLQAKHAAVPDKEWSVLTQYHNALVVALKHVSVTTRTSLDADVFEIIGYDRELPEEEEEEFHEEEEEEEEGEEYSGDYDEEEEL